jgi:hypothetical protein
MKEMRTALFLAITKWAVANCYRRFRTNYWSHLHLRFTILHEIIFQQFPMLLLVWNGKKSSKAVSEQNHTTCNNKWGTKVQFHTFITLTLWRVVAFVPQPLYSRKQLERRLSKPLSQFRHGGKQKNPFPWWKTNPGLLSAGKSWHWWSYCDYENGEDNSLYNFPFMVHMCILHLSSIFFIIT